MLIQLFNANTSVSRISDWRATFFVHTWKRREQSFFLWQWSTINVTVRCSPTLFPQSDLWVIREPLIVHIELHAKVDREKKFFEIRIADDSNNNNNVIVNIWCARWVFDCIAGALLRRRLVNDSNRANLVDKFNMFAKKFFPKGISWKEEIYRVNPKLYIPRS